MTNLDQKAWNLYCRETAGDMDVRDNWDELPDHVKTLYRSKAKTHLTTNEYLMAKGLFHLATEHRKKTDEFATALAELLGLEPNSGSHIDDAIYAVYGNDSNDFNEVLRDAGITYHVPE